MSATQKSYQLIPMQCPSRRLQQDGEKISSIICQDTTLYREIFLPAMALRYNTSYHSTIVSTPFELLFCEKASLPPFPNDNIQQIHYGETSAAEHFNLLHWDALRQTSKCA
jgi:hypothetical protein